MPPRRVTMTAKSLNVAVPGNPMTQPAEPKRAAVARRTRTVERGSAMPREYDPSRTCMKVENWPAAERIAWEAALKPGRLFNKPGGGAHWAPPPGLLEGGRKSKPL